MKLELAFDTETTGLIDRHLPFDHPSQPHLTQIAAVLRESETRHTLASMNMLVKPEGWTVSKKASELTGITDEKLHVHGLPRVVVLSSFSHMLKQADTVICHNTGFDIDLMRIQFMRIGKPYELKGKRVYCTMLNATDVVGIPSPKMVGKNKWPKLEECMKFFFDEGLDGAHDAMVDITATLRVYDELMKLENKQ